MRPQRATQKRVKASRHHFSLTKEGLVKGGRHFVVVIYRDVLTEEKERNTEHLTLYIFTLIFFTCSWSIRSSVSRPANSIDPLLVLRAISFHWGPQSVLRALPIALNTICILVSSTMRPLKSPVVLKKCFRHLRCRLGLANKNLHYFAQKKIRF